MHFESEYRSPWPIHNGHIETIIPYFFRRVNPLPYTRERIDTDDGDFLDIDWVKQGCSSLVVLSHGLEGCSQSTYIYGMGHELLSQGHDVVCWNNRSCSGEMNRLFYSYHSGASYDLRSVLKHILSSTDYKEIYLVGFSMGGNQTLKYLGEESDQIDDRIKKAVAISTPVSLADCSKALASPMGKIYTKNFIIRMIRKLKLKLKDHSGVEIDFAKAKNAWTFETFDNNVTAPLFGFKNAQDYWDKASSLPWLKDITIPTLILNAKNDPFLMGRCFPFSETKDHPYVHLESPETGGHVGFPLPGLSKVWTENRVSSFVFTDEVVPN